MNHRFATLRANLLYQLHGAKSPSPCPAGGMRTYRRLLILYLPPSSKLGGLDVLTVSFPGEFPAAAAARPDSRHRAQRPGSADDAANGLVVGRVISPWTLAQARRNHSA